MNDYEIKVVKLKGEFVWHTYGDTGELFLGSTVSYHPAARWWFFVLAMFVLPRELGAANRPRRGPAGSLNPSE